MTIACGIRVDVNGNKGTVKYIGKIQGYDGEWLGIDWEDTKRGKHNGISLCACTGRDLIEEISARYVGGEVGKYLHDINIGMKKCEYVGMEKIYQKQCGIYKLYVIVLDNMSVSSVTSSPTQKFTHCTELNLHNNLISKWSDVFNILRLFPLLRYFNLCKNLMEPLVELPTAYELRDLPSIFHLILSECQIDERTAANILKIFDKIEELHIARNEIKQFEPLKNSYIKHLNLSGNPIKDFSMLWNLSKLQELEILNISSCSLQSFELSSINDIGFKKLRNLIIDDNVLVQWTDINQMAKLPTLKKLKLKGKMPAQNGLDVREMIIAKIPTLRELDHCDISSIERRSSEIRFLNHFGNEPIDEVHLKDIQRLILKHGPPDPPVGPEFANKKIPTLQVKLKYGEKLIERSVTQMTSIHRLIGMASRILKFDPSEVKIEIHRNGMPTETLQNITNDLQLGYLDLNTGDLFCFVKCNI